MRSSFLVLYVAALEAFYMVDYSLSPTSTHGSLWTDRNLYAYLEASSDIGRFYLEIRLNGQVRKTTGRNSYSLVLLKPETGDRLSIMGVKSNRYLCLDPVGNLFALSIFSKEDCLFSHVLSEKRHGVYDSRRNGALLTLEEAPSLSTLTGSPGPQGLALQRGKRNQQVNSGDPLNVGGALRRPLQRLLEQSHAISRESVSSVTHDDPLQVLTPTVPRSPQNTGAADKIRQKRHSERRGRGRKTE